MKLTDKVIFGMVSELPGPNASEPTGGLDNKKVRRPSPLLSGEGSMAGRNLTAAASHSGGVVGTAAYSSHRERRIQSKLNSESGEAERSSKR